MEIEDIDPQEALLRLLSSENITSKEWVYSQYDHEVQLHTVVKPGDDAAVIKVDEDTSFTIGTDCNSTHVLLNPYDGAASAVLESINNAITMGARPVALVDCLNFGNPEKPEVFWQFTEAISGMSDVARKFNVAFISGNVSFYNETEGVTVNPSPIVGCVGLVDNKHIKTMTYDEEGDVVLLLGNTYPELDGSQYYKEIYDLVQGYPPKLRLEENYSVSVLVQNLIQECNDSITSVHDLSKGGLATALALMSIKSEMGLKVCVEDIPSTGDLTISEKLFSESYSRFIITVKEDNLDEVTSIIKDAGVAYAKIGFVGGNNLVICSDEGKLIDVSVDELNKANTTTIEEHMA